MKVETKQVGTLKHLNYSVPGFDFHPTNEDIKKAIEENNIETRGYQKDIDELNKEWNQKANNEKEYYELQKDYHARRVAYFVISDWNDRIVLNKDGVWIKDGSTPCYLIPVPPLPL
jgi:hypothetical protein